MSYTALVTGAGGFIGSHLVETLVEKGYTVKAMVRYNSSSSWGWLERIDKKVLADVEVIASDVRDPFAVNNAVKGVGTVFHLAALIGIPYSYHAPQSYVDTNVSGTLNVLQASLDHDVQRVVHTSTSETYGSAQYIPMDEKHPLVGQSPYSASKIAADKLAESFYLSFGLPVSTIRPFNTFGPRQSARAVIPTVMTQALSGMDCIRIGSSAPLRDFTFVKDTAEAFYLAAKSDATVGRAMNVGNGKSISIGELAGRILDLCGSSAKLTVEEERVRPASSEVDRLECDARAFKEACGWEPKYSLESGLEQTMLFLRENMELYKPELYNV